MKLSLAHLPRTARDLIELIGLPATLALVASPWAGRMVQIAKGRRRAGVAQIAELAEIVGEHASRLIVRRYAGTILSIPTCKRALLAVRDAELHARFGAMTGREGLSARAAVDGLVSEYRIVASSVWRALKRSGVDLADPAATVDAAQLDLFGGAP